VTSRGASAKPSLSLRKMQRVYVDTCPRCGLCVPSCPAYELTSDYRLAPSYKVKLVKAIEAPSIIGRLLGLRRAVDVEALATATYSCALCGRCEEACPFGIDTVSLWLSLRESLHSAGLNPEPLKGLEDQLLKSGNPYGAPPSMRTYWPELFGLDEALRRAAGRRADTVLFMGCTPALRSAAQEILAAAVMILEKVREGWTTLGDQEWCCGYPLLLLGNREEAERCLSRNVELLLSLGAKRLVTVCPSCYKMFKIVYEELKGAPPPLQVMHVTQLLAEYLTKLRLEVPRKLSVRVAYHDPCDLARASRVLEEPRLVIREVAQELVELPRSGLRTSCCGGGGLLQASNNSLRLKIARRRLEEALSVKADVLASACPACKSTFIEAAREGGLEVEVLDVAELVARAVGLSR
jgi:heterodisulfide reductase subunit D